MFCQQDAIQQLGEEKAVVHSDDDHGTESDCSSFYSSSCDSSWSDFDLSAPRRPHAASSAVDEESPGANKGSSGLFLSIEMVQMLRTATSEGDVVALNNLARQINTMTPPARRNSEGGDQPSRMVFALQTKSPTESHLVHNDDVAKPKTTFEQILKEKGTDFQYQNYNELSDFFVKGCVSSHSFELMTAIRQNDISVLRQHHAVGWNLQCCNKFGETILHAAARRGFSDILKYLGSVGVSMRVCCDGGRTPMHDACWTGHPDFSTIRFLLEDCPDFLLIQDQRGFTPLDFIPREAYEEWNAFLNQNTELVIPREFV